MNQFSKCRYCTRYNMEDGCYYRNFYAYGCNNHEDYKPDPYRVLDKAKELNISVVDLLALIEMEDY